MKFGALLMKYRAVYKNRLLIKLRGSVQKSVDSIAQVIKGERNSLSKLLKLLMKAIATVKKIRDGLDAISK